ncbi:cytochrome P450 [Prochlorococcus sp. MIT 1341]|uniref:cytochrome P450 n=1 Tax=Prochlorococcus sp. MIT 1341 TaxID=3096221 RepID=UPI002A747B28|nr:cytochrome P450 [Prochlorococcus sp. MIT 1341]
MTEVTKQQRNEPPWPKPLPYTANILHRLARGWKTWLGLLNEWDFRIPIGEINILGLPVFLINDPPLVRRILVDEVENFPKHPYTLWILEPLIGRAIFSVNGEEWQWQRRLIDQAFQVAKLNRVFPSMAGATEDFIKRLHEHKSQQPIDIDAEMTLVTADVIMRTILSRPLSEGESKKIFLAFSRYQRKAGRALVLRFLNLPKSLIQINLKNDAKIIRDWIHIAIKERLKKHAEGDETSSTSMDLLDCLIMANDPETKRKFSEKQLVDQICFLFLAGHETSASSLGVATWLLALYQDIQQKLREEVLLVSAGKPVQEQLEQVEIRKLNYCSAIFNETLRLYPPVSFFIRERIKTDTNFFVSGEKSKCPLGALLTLSPWVIQRHENHWEDPQVFKPERFLKTKESRWVKEAFLPFGIGPRKCPGAAFAQQEAVLVLAELVRNFKVSPAKGHIPNLTGRLTLRSSNGIKLLLQKV